MVMTSVLRLMHFPFSWTDRHHLPPMRQYTVQYVCSTSTFTAGKPQQLDAEEFSHPDQQDTTVSHTRPRRSVFSSDGTSPLLILYVAIEGTLVLYSRRHKNSTGRNSTLTPLIFIKTDIYIANWNTLMTPFTHGVHRTAQFMLTYNPVLHILAISHSVIHYIS